MIAAEGNLPSVIIPHKKRVQNEASRSKTCPCAQQRTIQRTCAKNTRAATAGSKHHHLRLLSQQATIVSTGQRPDSQHQMTGHNRQQGPAAVCGDSCAPRSTSYYPASALYGSGYLSSCLAQTLLVLLRDPLRRHQLADRRVEVPLGHPHGPRRRLGACGRRKGRPKG